MASVQIRTVDHAMVHRRVVRISPEMLERFKQQKPRITGKRHIDETYIKVRDRWTYLNRAIDSNCGSVKFRFGDQRNLTNAIRFLCKALGWHGRPERIVIDGNQTEREAIVSCDTTDRLQDRARRGPKLIRVRQSAFLDTRIEQAHRASKRRVRRMLGYQSVVPARAILDRIEMIHMMRTQLVKGACIRYPSLAEQFDLLTA